MSLTGSYLLSKAFWENCPEVIENEKQWLAILQEQARSGVVKACVFEKPLHKKLFCHQDENWLYLAANFFWRLENEGRGVQVSELAQVAPTARLLGDVKIEAGARVGEFCVLRGPVYLGKETVVEDFSRVKEAFVEANCCLGVDVNLEKQFLPLGSQAQTRRQVRITNKLNSNK